MSLAGGGAVAIWNDITPEGRAVFYAWHGREHVPERVGIPGFLRGRRYVAIHGRPEYFTLYETERFETLTSEDYAKRLNAPTPWTVEAVSHFRNVARSLCRVLASEGEGEGGLIATWRYDVRGEAADAHRRALVDKLLPDIARRSGVAGAHLLATDEAASRVDTAERRSRGTMNEVPPWVLLVEGWDDTEAFDALCREGIVPALAAAPGVDGRPDYGLYRLQLSRAKSPATPN